METWRGQHCSCQKIQTHTSQKNYYFYLYMLGQDKYVFMWLCVSAHKYVYVEVRGQYQGSLSVILHLIFEIECLSEPEGSSLGSGTSLSLLCSSVLELQMWATAPDFHMGAGHLNESLQVCELSPLSTEPSPQLLRPVWRDIKNDKARLLKGACSHLGIQLIHYKMTERCLEEVILCTVLQQGVIHSVCSYLGREDSKVTSIGKQSTAYSPVLF